MNERNKKVKCLYGDKGAIRMIPEKFANDFKYMQRHGLQRLDIPEIEPIITEIKDVVFDMQDEKTDPSFEPEIVEDVTKEQLYELLDQKGIEYKKTYGVEKLKQLLNS